MKIAIIGFGKMGREIESIARQQGEVVSKVFDIGNPVTARDLSGVDVCIDFSTPDAVMDNIRAAVDAKTDIVVGTTGWHGRLPEVREMVRHSGLLYSANFSLGMNIFFRIVARAAELVRDAPDYDPFVHEMHHSEKTDSPSGTALRIAGILMERIDRKTELLGSPPDGKISPHQLHVSSTRAGAIAGIHTVGFDSDADLIELRHTAKSRRGFALGALTAARWLHGRTGVYTMDDVEF